MSGAGLDSTKVSTENKINNFNRSVLLVEDDSLQAYVFEKMLSVLGCTVIGKTRTGEEAIDLAMKLKPDVLLMDITLAGKIDGIAAVIEIQQEIKLPVVYTTGNETEHFLKRAQNTDFVDFISKPITMDLLIQALKKLNT